MKVVLMLALVLSSARAFAAAPAEPLGGDVTGTVKVSGLEIPRNEFSVAPRDAYIHVVWDSSADRGAIKAAGKSFSLPAAALDLARSAGVAGDSAKQEYKVDVVEFPERDDYGAPRWDKIVFVGRFVVTRNGKKWTVKKRPEGS